FVGKTLLHGDVLMWLVKTLLTSVCINQRGAGQAHKGNAVMSGDEHFREDVTEG
ncbi:hypothetical protein ABIC80_004850, partial [Kosakonia sp. 1610]